MSSSFFLSVALFALASFDAANAQQPGSAAWQQLRQHPNTWPAQVRLKAPVQLTIIANGQQVGALGAPADSMVNLLSVDETTLRVGVGSAQASVAPGLTDLAERLAALPPPAVTNAAPRAPTPSAVAAPTPTPPTPPDTGPAVLSGAPMEFDYEAAPADGYDRAAFHFWSPAYTQPLRGLIIMTPGNNGDGRGMTNDAAWQALARKYGLGLIGSCLQGRSYQRPERGTGDAFRDALRRFAGETGHPELTTVPLLLWGISAGGQWNYNYLLWRPDDVMAFVVNKGGYYNQDEPDSHALAVPGLFILGLADESFRINAITAIWKEGRTGGALWALAPQPNSGHEFSKTDPLARTFFEAVLKARLPDSPGLAADPTDSPPMKPMEENAGWLGNLTTHDIHDDSTDAEPDRTAAWLPDATTAQAWKLFVSGG